MSWDQGYDNSGYGNYENYGNYNDQQQFNPVSNAQYEDQKQSYGQTGSSYDMSGYNTNQQAQAPSASYYNPNEFKAEPLQQHQQQQQSWQQGPSSASQPNTMPGNFQVPGIADQMNPMVANMAMQYGQDIVGKGQEELKKNLDKYVSIGQLKYYFAVDTSYVGKKLGLLFFPFAHSDWSIKYSQDEPVQPKFDVNAPDLYIPCMAYLTYVLIVGYTLGLRSAFSPDLLATNASSALVWLVLELGCVYLTLTLMNISTNLCKWDVLSFSTYKYVGMIALLLSGLITGSRQGFYIALAYISGSLAFFLVRTLKLRIEPEVHGMQVHGKRKLYMILFYAGLQPLLIWWMTSYFAPMGPIDIPTPPQAP